jgi:hypothetical protein
MSGARNNHLGHWMSRILRNAGAYNLQKISIGHYNIIINMHSPPSSPETTDKLLKLVGIRVTFISNPQIGDTDFPYFFQKYMYAIVTSDIEIVLRVEDTAYETTGARKTRRGHKTPFISVL